MPNPIEAIAADPQAGAYLGQDGVDQFLAAARADPNVLQTAINRAATDAGVPLDRISMTDQARLDQADAHHDDNIAVRREGLEEDGRQFDARLGQDDRHHTDMMGERSAARAQDQDQFDRSMTQNAEQFEREMTLKETAMEAQRAGTPLAVHPSIAGLSEDMQETVFKEERGHLKDVSERNQALTEIDVLADQFLGLISAVDPQTGERTQTYHALGQGWISDIEQMFSQDKTRLTSITNRLTPLMRQAGSGQMSDKDAEMYRQSVPNINSGYEANIEIMKRGKAMRERAQMYEDALRSVSSIPGAQQEIRTLWEAYTSENSLFDPSGGILVNDQMDLTGPSFNEWLGAVTMSDEDLMASIYGGGGGGQP